MTVEDVQLAISIEVRRKNVLEFIESSKPTFVSGPGPARENLFAAEASVSIPQKHAIMRRSSARVCCATVLRRGDDQIGDSVTVEVVFARPGLGKMMVGAILQRDYTSLQSIMVVYTAFVVVINLIIDLIYGWVDPRIRH